MDDLKGQMREHFIRYASYVICDRAIPSVEDGLKPVQRRILEILWRQNDGKLHKVANIVGQSMQLHPHGDAPIYEALVHLANKGYLLDKQGNFGNLYTADPAAAARYIETRLSPLAQETLFNPDLTQFVPSYDGRNQEPVSLPAKIPLLLLQGAEGIAVGMSTKIFPHNFVELLEAEIACIEGKKFKLFPDFPTGGIMDKSEYDQGRGKVKLRAKIVVKDPKTLVIQEICYGTTTESLIRSIDEAAKKGKIRIEAIHDYTAQHVEIEIKLPRGHYAEEVLDALYAFTECEITLHSQIIVIKEGLPWETDVHEVLAYNAQRLVEFLRRELEIEKERLLEKIFCKTLERIFIENKIYKKIEAIKTLEGIHEMLDAAFKPYRKKLLREPTHEDRERLLQIPIRRISQFDINKNKEEIVLFEKNLQEVEKKLKNVKKYAISYLNALILKFGKEYPRRTKIKSIEEVDRRAMEEKPVQIGVDETSGFVGTKVQAKKHLKGTNFDKLAVLLQEGTYKVISIPEKQYIDKLAYVGIADKKTALYVVYKNKKTKEVWAKKFVVEKFILDKVYRYLSEEEEFLGISSHHHPSCELQLASGDKKVVSLDTVPLKGVQTKGIRLSKEKVKKVKVH